MDHRTFRRRRRINDYWPALVYPIVYIEEVDTIFFNIPLKHGEQSCCHWHKDGLYISQIKFNLG